MLFRSVEMAARTYFGTHAPDLTVPQAAMLVAMLKGPNQFNPVRFPEAARARAVEINRRVSVPPVSPGYPETLYLRMIARGIPQDLADDIAKSQAFWNLVAQRDSAVGSF